MCFDHMHSRLTNFTQTPKDMYFIPDVSVHYTIFKGLSVEM